MRSACRSEPVVSVGPTCISPKEISQRAHGVIPGHEIVGEVDSLGDHCTRFRVGDRVGIAWLRSTCGKCRWCRDGAENLCEHPRFTGWDADGGYAQHAVVNEWFAYSIPDAYR